ncbi:PRTRC system protein C [Flavobacterium sp. MFBS3-15]|nr:PRTRC system protein C [Flavobacterium sp. MFBS3-15]MCW4467665.1 PRTRC system protein C [Flavobacterium sp. MFBS3-15]
MMTTHLMPRLFTMKEQQAEITLADPDPAWSVDAVLHFYANTYPLLTTAKVSGPVIDNDAVQYRFESLMGTKG